jgi:tetratricopeptide (TPR) repeat protein
MKAIATRKGLLEGDHPLVLSSMHGRGLAVDAAGRSDEAISLLKRVRDSQARRLGDEHMDTLDTQTDLASTYRRIGRTDEAVALLERVRDVRVARLGGDHDLTLAALESLADAYVGAGKRSEAVELLERVRNSRAKKLGPDHPATLHSLESLAYAYQSAGQLKQSLALFEQARDAIVPRLGVGHPQTLNILDSLAKMYRAFGRTDEAIALAEQVRDARTKSLGAYHPHTIRTLDNLALAYFDSGKPDRALALWRQAAAGLERLGFVHGDSDIIIVHLCMSLDKNGQADQADDWRRKWLAAAREIYGPESAAYASALEQQGGILLDYDRHADAAPFLRECLAIRQRTRPDDWKTFLAHSFLGAALLGQREYAQAEPLVVDGYEGLKAHEKQIPRFFVTLHLTNAGARVVRLYEAWGRPHEAAAWRSKLNGQRPSQPAPPHPDLMR